MLASGGKQGLRVALIALGAMASLAFVAGAQEPMGEAPVDISELEYSDGGADTCIRCHGEESEYPVLEIIHTAHGQRGHPDSPFGENGLQCEACHGPGAEHSGRVRRGQERPSIPYFNGSETPNLAAENGICMDCHASTKLAGWGTSEHHQSELACYSCHNVHVQQDPMLDNLLQTDVCVGCHQRLRADIYRPYTHPLRFGQLACSDCHSPHSSLYEYSLLEQTPLQTCLTCHQELRGPFLWEHEPASEDCSYCHRAHGSNHPAMLTVRSPLLCQQCHSRLDHPALAYTSDQLPGEGGNLSAFVLSRGCQNCHSAVHGSNHPSGNFLVR